MGKRPTRRLTDHMRATFFQKGTCERRDQRNTQKWSTDKMSQAITRLPADQFEKSFTTDQDITKLGTLFKQTPTTTILRPKTSEPTLIEAAAMADESKVNEEAELNTYRLFHFGKTESMFYEAYNSHRELHPNCKEKLTFDLDYEQKWGFAWRERLQCRSCGFVTKNYNLYEEVNTTNRGRKAANINLSAQSGIMDLPIGNSSLRFMMICLHTVPPSVSGMQRRSNYVADTVETVAEKGFARVRQQLRSMNEACGLLPDNGIPAAIDSQYNNALRSAGDRTPQQPATQVTTTMVEQCSKDQKVIGMTMGNKLKKGNKNNVHEGAVIGDERREAYRLMSTILQSDQPVRVDKLTTDGDSQAHKGVSAANSDYDKTAVTERLADTTHLSKRLYAKLKSTNFSEHMFIGNTKKRRTYIQGRFARDICNRVNLELANVFNICNGNVDTIKMLTSGIVTSILQCYSGKCRETCADNSFTCSGKPPFNWKMDFIPADAKYFDMTNNDKLLVKNAILSYRLGDDMIEKTRLNSNTNKIESINRAYNTSNPKDSTYLRNAKARKMSAAFRINEGTANSNLEKMAALGASLHPHTKAVRALKNVQDRKTYHKRRQASQQYKHARFVRRVINFNKYDEIHDPRDSYQKGLLDP